MLDILGIIVNIVSIIVTVISIIITVINAKQCDCTDKNKHQKSNRPDQG